MLPTAKMAEEKIIDDVIEVEDTGYVETYIRFNDDLEKDYCFQVKTSDSFKDLFKIFKTLPIALRPNLFYNSLPLGFYVSTAPGYLTEDGGLLFSYETSEERFRRKVGNSDKLFKLHRAPVQAAVTKEQLLDIGWTGTRRACPDEYKDFYRDYKIKEHGGMIPAHQAGVFDKLKNLGVFLGLGEGFNTPLDNKSTIKDLLSEENEKFTLNYQYFAQLGEFFQNYTNEHESNLIEAIKQFRRYGILHSNDTIAKIVKNRKSRGDSRV
ncbi:hypothetical protein QCA50_019453 [Cerrena zonata]|uniref:Uncharacterized protein n=1 Tax=Cerrena zonata TaxID=2478898 RepID=A0AAW0FLH3_9APHY